MKFVGLYVKKPLRRFGALISETNPISVPVNAQESAEE